MATLTGREPLLPASALEGDPGGSSGYQTRFPGLCVVPGRCVLTLTFLSGAALALCLTVFKEWLAQRGMSSIALLKYVSIPVVSTIFTYCHIWAALWMTFYPVRYVGCLQIHDTNVGCGWQGIVPNRAFKMSKLIVDNMLAVLSVEEIVSRIDPVIVVEELDPVLRSLVTTIIHTIAMDEAPELWGALPNMAKNELITKAREDAGPAIVELLNEVRVNIKNVFDISEMVVEGLTRDRALLDHMFITIGFKELVFIRDFGATMGLVFGIIQVLLWIFYSAGWMLPTFGFVVGMATNWIALKMIFEPVDPVRLPCGVVLQGLFLKRQVEASAEYGKLMATNLLSSRNMIKAIVTGRCSDKLFELIRRHVRATCDGVMGRAKPVIHMLGGTATLDHVKNEVGNHLIANLAENMRHAERYMDSAMDLENVLRLKIEAMAPKDFEQMLHPVFQEDEWKLVLLGGVLGVFVGFCQWQALGS